MSKVIDKVKEIFKSINIFDEGIELEAPDSIKEMAMALSDNGANSPAEIQKILEAGKYEPEQLWTKNFINTKNSGTKKIEYKTIVEKKQEEGQSQLVENEINNNQKEIEER